MDIPNVLTIAVGTHTAIALSRATSGFRKVFAVLFGVSVTSIVASARAGELVWMSVAGIGCVASLAASRIGWDRQKPGVVRKSPRKNR